MRVVPQLTPRYIAGYRIHHGLVGAVMAFIGIVLMLDDAHDFPWPFKD